MYGALIIFQDRDGAGRTMSNLLYCQTGQQQGHCPCTRSNVGEDTVDHAVRSSLSFTGSVTDYSGQLRGTQCTCCHSYNGWTE